MAAEAVELRLSDAELDGVTAGAGWAFIFTGRYSGYPTTAGPQQVFQLQGSAGQAMGRSVAVIGTHDGDGIADLVIAGDADASNRGIVVRIPGAQSFLAGNRADISEVGNGFWSGEATGEEVGFSVDGGVDVDGNCYDDLLIGLILLIGVIIMNRHMFMKEKQD